MPLSHGRSIDLLAVSDDVDTHFLPRHIVNHPVISDPQLAKPFKTSVKRRPKAPWISRQAHLDGRFNPPLHFFVDGLDVDAGNVGMVGDFEGHLREFYLFQTSSWERAFLESNVFDRSEALLSQ